MEWQLAPSCFQSKIHEKFADLLIILNKFRKRFHFVPSVTIRQNITNNRIKRKRNNPYDEKNKRLWIENDGLSSVEGLRHRLLFRW